MRVSTFASILAVAGLAVAAPAADKTKDVKTTEAQADNDFFVINWRRDAKKEAQADSDFHVTSWRRDEKKEQKKPEVKTEAEADNDFFVINWRRDNKDGKTEQQQQEETADSDFFVVNWKKREAEPARRGEDGTFHLLN